MTKEVYFEELFCQIPDVSTKTPKAICKKFVIIKIIQKSLNTLSHILINLQYLKIYIEMVNGKNVKFQKKY